VIASILKAFFNALLDWLYAKIKKGAEEREQKRQDDAVVDAPVAVVEKGNDDGEAFDAVEDLERQSNLNARKP
jgi:hypothetical protein